jgi:hypothetical protein
MYKVWGHVKVVYYVRVKGQVEDWELSSSFYSIFSQLQINNEELMHNFVNSISLTNFPFFFLAEMPTSFKQVSSL